MRVLLVDDEPLALIGLRMAIEDEFGDMEVVAAYSNPTEVVTGVMEHCPDVVFLDIHMPEIDGLQLARQLQAVAQGIEIVFITSYDQYAIRAFELYALDYIMKPVERQRLIQTVMRVKEKLNWKNSMKPPRSDASWICCFDRIRFRHPGMESQPVKWRTSRAQELFAYLLHHRNRMVSRSALLELLWQDNEEPTLMQLLYTEIYHVRQTLKRHKMDMISIYAGELEAGYRLDIGDARVDTEAWEHAVKQMGHLDASTVGAYERVLLAYEGGYLGQYEYLWAEHERERLRLLWLYNMNKVSEFYERHGMPDKAIQVNRRAQDLYPEEEGCYFALMKLYDAIGNKIEVEEQYLLLQTRLQKELELPISAHVARWYEQWKLSTA
ncbi:response regulator [Cohnella herbarum]|uniref:Response regulator n=1 Tax=Cohnella herbarum TaxID=2728023 RepID=A0A7Z2ZMC8_9BACL|nr:response regulator [Cohnella herbarum]QJD84710.1 response regulator [Cohnella herbarum]